MFDVLHSADPPEQTPVENANHPKWVKILLDTGFDRKAELAKKESTLSPNDMISLARSVFDEVREKAINDGVPLTENEYGMLLNRLSGLGVLADLIASSDVEDIAVNLGHVYVFTTRAGWKCVGPADNEVSTLRVELGRQKQKAPTYDVPIVDAMLKIAVYTENGPAIRNVRVNFISEPACPYGDLVTMRVARRRTKADIEKGNLSLLCQGRLPPIPRPEFKPKDYPDVQGGVMTPAAANYLLSVMVHGGTLVLAGSTGSGKTYIAQLILQEMLDYFPQGSIRLFVVEDSQEIVLNGWDGDSKQDTGNIAYSVTRPEAIEGPPPITMYDLIRAALRARPHGLVIGEARGPEAWELVRAASTGHGHSAFTIHATNIETVWPRFLQVARAHKDAAGLSDEKIAAGFASAVTAVVFVERHVVHGQTITHISEIGDYVDPDVGLPVMRHLFTFDPAPNRLVPTGLRPSRRGFECSALGLPPAIFEN